MEAYSAIAVNTSDISLAMREAVQAGVSVIPVDPKTKRPAISAWKPYQTRMATGAELTQWAGAGAYAAVGGAVSGGLVVLDFDVPGFYGRWCDAVGTLSDGLPVQRTGGGGYQVLFRCPNPGGNDKLAWAVDENAPTGRAIAVETRAEGGYAVLAPSQHPSGNLYQWLNGNASGIPTIEQGHADRLLAAARALDEAPRPKQERERLEAQARQAHGKRRAGMNGQASVIGAFNAAHDLEATLERYGYTRGPRGRYIRPGGQSESVSVRDGRSCHWSSNDPLTDGHGPGGCGCHDSFDVFAHFEHGGDVGRAVRDAAELMRMAAASTGRRAAELNPADHIGGPVLTCLADVEAREISWLWPGRIPLGRITLLVGRPGEGKSFLTTDMAARISTGTPWPDGSDCPKGSTILVSAEDDPADTIRPRLDAHRADCRRVHLLSAVRWIDDQAKPQERMFTLADLPALEAALKAHPDCRLIVIDPIGSFLGGETDAHRDNEVRGVLAPVARLAEKYGPAVVMVAHRRKSGGSFADDLALGSRAFTGIARAVWHLSRDNENKARRLLLGGKNNLAREGDGLAFVIAGEPPEVRWEREPVTMSADDALAVEGETKTGPEPEARNMAAEWLAGELADWQEHPVSGLKDAARAAGLVWRTVRRAAEVLKVISHRASFGGGYVWRLPKPGSGPGDEAPPCGPTMLAKLPKSETTWPLGPQGENPTKTHDSAGQVSLVGQVIYLGQQGANGDYIEGEV